MLTIKDVFREEDEGLDDLTLEFDVVEVVLVEGRRVEKRGTKDERQVTRRHSVCTLVFGHPRQKPHQELEDVVVGLWQLIQNLL